MNRSGEAVRGLTGVAFDPVVRRKTVGSPALPRNAFPFLTPIFDTSDKNRREEVRFDGGFDVSERKTWCHE
jgi:hypothetical protein